MAGRPTDRARLVVWVLAGGLCARCKQHVLDESIEYLPLGEVAHNAGRSDGEGTPRLRKDLSDQERNQPQNLLLLCRPCHKIVDSDVGQSVYGVEQLRELKVQHESQVRDRLSLLADNTTLVVRVVGKLHDDTTVITRRTAMAVTAEHGRLPLYLPRLHRSELAVDLTGLPESDLAYWEVALRQLHTGVETIRAAIDDGLAEHVTLFALARMPILVALGWHLDDTIPTHVVHVSHGDPYWMPNVGAREREFGIEFTPGPVESGEGVIVLRLSGSPDASRFPAEIRDLPRVSVHPTGGRPAPTIADSPNSQRRIELAIETALHTLEDELKTPTVLHVVAAAPNDSLVQVGRLIDRRTYPTAVVYDRRPDDSYTMVYTLNAQSDPPTTPSAS